MAESAASTSVKTRFLLLSDTHGLSSLPHSASIEYTDVVLHCGDLTKESKLHEFEASIRLLKTLNAPLKLVIAGNHDFTMDIPAFRKKVAEAPEPLDPGLVSKFYGSYGEARRLFNEETGIIFLDEGIHTFSLKNGALLKVYSSPYTPSLGDWGFQYHPQYGHEFSIHDADVVMTHGPPRGIMDYTYSGQRAGCPNLFEAVARARPQMHCFGHIHEGWGAKLVTWRLKASAKPTHFTDIDNGKSTVIGNLSTLADKENIMPDSTTAYFTGDTYQLKCGGSQTLFVNSAIEDANGLPTQQPWLVDLDLPVAPK